MRSCDRNSWLALLAIGALALSVVACSDSGKECASGQTDCDGKCVDLATDEDHCGKCDTTCDEGAGFYCSDKQCTCVGDETECDGACVNTSADKANCGECGKACADGEICNGGNCTPSSECKDPKKVCDGFCADIDSDNANCGDCGVKCDETKGYTCVASKCTCAKDLIECDGTCVNPNSAVDNCGECGNACTGGQVCQAGKCEAGCTDPLTECDGSCIDTSSDNNNCGACGTKCETLAGKICVSGTCECALGTDCGGQCVDTDTNGNHCGACDKVCGPGEACKNGVCSIDCDPLTQCGNKCVDTGSDPSNCGACGTACTGGKICATGACSCPTNMPDECSDVCTDMQLDEANCGTCGNACGAGESCVGGACQAAQLTSLTVSCPETNVPQGMIMPCTATGILQSGQTADMTADANLIWDLDNVQCPVTAENTPAGKVSNTPPTKGQFTAWENIGCTVDIRAIYTTATGTLTATPLTLTIIQRKLLSIAVSPADPVVPYLWDTTQGAPSKRNVLQINFKVLGTYDSGQVIETQLIKSTKTAKYTWKNGNDNTASKFDCGSGPVCTLQLNQKAFPTTTEATQVDVTYLEDDTDPNTARTGSSTLTVKPGNATGASIQPTTASIPVGPLHVSLVVNFNNDLDFDVVDLCATRTQWYPFIGGEGPFRNPGYTKHFQNYCPDVDGSKEVNHSFLLHEVNPTSAPPQDPGYGIKTHFNDYYNMVLADFPATVPFYTPREAGFRAHTPTSGSPAVIEANFWDGGYSVNRVYGRAQVTVGPAVIQECRIRSTERLSRRAWPPNDPDTDRFVISDKNGNNKFPVGLVDQQVWVAANYTDRVWKIVNADVTLTSSNEAVATVSNAVGEEGRLDMLAVGTATIVATDPVSGMTCQAKIVVEQSKLCELQLLPQYKGRIGRRAMHGVNKPFSGGAGPWFDGPDQVSHKGLNTLLLPNEDDWKQAYRAYAWYSTDATSCPGYSNKDGSQYCGWQWDKERNEFRSTNSCGTNSNQPCCFKIDVTDQAAWSVVPDPGPVPADPALVHQGTGVFTSKATNNDNVLRGDQVKATFGTVTTISATESVAVCGDAIAGSFKVWSHLEDSTANSRDVPAWIGVGGTTGYDASTQFLCDRPDVSGLLPPPAVPGDDYAYRLQITEDLNQWGSVSTDKATIQTAEDQRGEIKGEAEGKSLITAIWKGATQSLDVNIGKVAVASCRVNVPSNKLREGGGLGETMHGSITVTMTDGTTINTTHTLKIDFCDNPDTDPTVEECNIAYKTDGSDPNNSGSDYFLIGEPASANITADNSGTDSTKDSRAIMATCIACGIDPVTGDPDNVTCDSSGQVEIVRAAVSGLYVQADHTPCAAGPLTSQTLNVGTKTDLKGCLQWEHGALQAFDDDGGTGALTWSGGASVSPAPGGVITVNGTGSNTITATHAGSSQSGNITIVGTADPFTSIEITGANMGICASQPNPPTDGLQGCVFELMQQRFRLIGKRADDSIQDLTVLTISDDWSDNDTTDDERFNFNVASDPGWAAGTDADNNGTFTDTVISVATGFTATLCSTPAVCNGPVTANVRVYDADPIQSTMALLPSTLSVSGSGQRITNRVTAQPNGVTTPPDIDVTNAIDFANDNAAVFFTFASADNRLGTNGDCVSMPVGATSTAELTATLPQAAIGGTATALSTTTTLTVTP